MTTLNTAGLGIALLTLWGCGEDGEVLHPPPQESSIIRTSNGTTSSQFGGAVSDAGDLDGDGFGDVVVGAYGDSTHSPYGGAAYVYFGSKMGVEVSTEVKLVELDASSGQFGLAVSGAGDVDGDGIDDLVVGAPYEDASAENAGAVYFYRGGSRGELGASDRVVDADGQEGSVFGCSLSQAGDVNGDGYGDVVIGAMGATSQGARSGLAYVFLGGQDGLSSSAQAALQPSNADDVFFFGASVAGAGDVDGDGYDDVVVGSRTGGTVAVFSGDEDGVDSEEETLITNKSEESTNFGSSVSGASDTNGDGYDDVVVGAETDRTLGAAAGAAYVYLGGSSGVEPNSEILLLEPNGGMGHHFGSAVSTAKDVDGDGHGDILVGAYAYEDENVATGAGYLYFGGTYGISDDEYSRLLASDAEKTFDLGRSVSTAGDVDGDGADDLLLGAPNLKEEDYEGAVYIYHGACGDSPCRGGCASVGRPQGFPLIVFSFLLPFLIRRNTGLGSHLDRRRWGRGSPCLTA